MRVVFGVSLLSTCFLPLVQGRGKKSPKTKGGGKGGAGRPAGLSAVPHRVNLPGKPREPILTCPPDVKTDYTFDTTYTWRKHDKNADADGFIWDPATPPSVREKMKARYKQVLPGPPGSLGNDRWREYCARSWFELEAFGADTSKNKIAPFRTACNDQSHSNPDKIPAALCFTEPMGWTRHPRMWWKKSPRRRDGTRTKKDAALVEYSVGAMIMAGEAHDTEALCRRTECRNTTFAAGSILARRDSPRELLKPLRELGKGRTKARSVAWLTRTLHPMQEAANGGLTKSDANWHRFNFFAALKHAGVTAESPRTLDTAPKIKGATHFSANRTLGGSTACEFVEASELYRPYLMVIAFENGRLYNQVTEKIANVFFSGAIPIYWGDDRVYRYFNRKAFINANDFPDLWTLAQHVANVMSNCTLQEQYLSEPPCTLENLQNLFWWRGKDRLFERALPYPPCG